TTYSNKPVPPALVDCYRRLMAFARHSVATALAAETAAAWEFLDEFQRHLVARRRAGGLLRFDDVTRTLEEGLQTTAADFDYRVGDRLGHLLLDEFQDTSTSQWTVLKRLAARAMAAGGTFFGVGDVKQAIYSWRGGRAELLVRLPTELGIDDTLDMDK